MGWPRGLLYPCFVSIAQRPRAAAAAAPRQKRHGGGGAGAVAWGGVARGRALCLRQKLVKSGRGGPSRSMPVLNGPELSLIEDPAQSFSIPVQPFSQKSLTATVPKVFQIGLCGVVEADLELFCNSWSVGFLGERLYKGSQATQGRKLQQ